MLACSSDEAIAAADDLHWSVSFSFPTRSVDRLNEFLGVIDRQEHQLTMDHDLASGKRWHFTESDGCVA
jgi:hypothetical protein